MERKRWKVVRWVGASGTEYGGILEDGAANNEVLTIAFARQIVNDHNAVIELGLALEDAVACYDESIDVLPRWYEPARTALANLKGQP